MVVGLEVQTKTESILPFNKHSKLGLGFLMISKVSYVFQIVHSCIPSVTISYEGMKYDYLEVVGRMAATAGGGSRHGCPQGPLTLPNESIKRA